MSCHVVTISSLYILPLSSYLTSIVSILHLLSHAVSPYEQRTKPITSAKGRGWNGHRFLCVPYRSWGFGVRGHEMTKWLKKIEAEAAEEKAAMKMNSFLQQGSHFGALCGDVSVRTQKLRKWSSFGHRFGHRSELPFTFGFLCVHFVHDTSIDNFWHTTFECFWRLHFVPILTCWMNVFKFKNLANMCIKSHRFLCNPYRSWEFHDSIKYQCPGVTVPNGRRFWRALI